MFKNERGQTLIEFAIAFPVFIAFLYGLIGISLWGIGGHFVQSAAHEATIYYATMLEKEQTEELAKALLAKEAYPFVDPDTVNVELSHDQVKAYGVVTAQPRVQTLFMFSMPELRRESSCTLEYRFRNPDEFL